MTQNDQVKHSVHQKIILYYYFFVEELKKTQKRFKEYDGTYFGHYVQWVFMFFFYIGLFAAFSVVGVWIAKAKGWL